MKSFSEKMYFSNLIIQKNSYFFQIILDITSSVTFKLYFLDEKHTDPTYSTFKIHKIIAPSDWEDDLNVNLNFPKNLKDLTCYDAPFH